MLQGNVGTLHAGSAAHLPQHVAAQVAAVGSGCQDLLDQWQQQQHASRDHLQALQQAIGILTQLVKDHLLGQQQVCTLFCKFVWNAQSHNGAGHHVYKATYNVDMQC